MSSEDAKNLCESLLRLHLTSKITPATTPSRITLLHETLSSSDYVTIELRRSNLKSLPEFRGVASITLPKTAKHISRVQTSGPERGLRTRATAIWEGLSQTKTLRHISCRGGACLHPRAVVDRIPVFSISLVQYQQVTISRVRDRRHMPHLLLWKVGSAEVPPLNC